MVLVHFLLISGVISSTLAEERGDINFVNDGGCDLCSPISGVISSTLVRCRDKVQFDELWE